MSLIRAVEKFDFSRGNKFSTYASWAIMKNFARTIPEENYRRDRFVTGHEEMFEAAADNRTDEHEYESALKRMQEAVKGMLGRLDDRERRIIISRFGLGGASEQTLEQLGRELGITKERVRQIESRGARTSSARSPARRSSTCRCCEAETNPMDLPDFLTHGPLRRDPPCRGIGLTCITSFTTTTKATRPKCCSVNSPLWKLATIHKVIAFYLDNRAEVDAYAKGVKAQIEEQRAAGQHVPSLAELRRRLEARERAEHLSVKQV